MNLRILQWSHFSILFNMISFRPYLAKSSQWLVTLSCFSLSKYFLDSLPTDSPWINARSFTSVCCVGNTFPYLSNGYKIDYAKRLLFPFHLHQNFNVPTDIANVLNMTLKQGPFGTFRNILGGNTGNQNEAQDETNTHIPRLTQDSRSGRCKASRLIDCAYGQMYVYIAGNTVEVQTQSPTHRNVIGRTMISPPTVIVQQYSSAIFF